VAAYGFERISHDPRIEVVPFTHELNEGALRLFTDRSDKEWSLTDCLSFVVMGRRNVQQALTADHHFEQAGFRAVLSETPPSG
jgi:predicted nucleic acid-binding protein